MFLFSSCSNSFIIEFMFILFIIMCLIIWKTFNYRLFLFRYKIYVFIIL